MLAFNIHSLDTIKYSPASFKTQFEKALRLTISSTEEPDKWELGDTVTDSIAMYFELKGLKPHEKTWTVENTHYLPFERFNYGVTLFSLSDAERIHYETKVIVRRLERFISNIDRKLEENNKAYENADTDPKRNGIRKQIERFQKQKESATHPRFTIILMQPEAKTLLSESFEKIESTLFPELSIISYDELKSEMETI